MGVVNGSDYGTPSLDLNFARNKSLIDTTTGRNLITFTRSSTGTYVGADGLIKTAKVDEPRFDHNPITGVCNGLLIEESRTNSLPYSSTFTTGWHLVRAQTTTGQPGLESGVNNAILVQQTNGTSTRQYISSTTSLKPGSSYTASVFVKYYNYNFVVFSAADEDSGATGDRFGYLMPKLRFNFSTETIDYQDAGWGGGSTLAYGFDRYPNGWYRLWLTRNAGIRNNYWGIAVQSDWNNNISDLALVTGDGISGVYVYGFQVEAGSFPTSYIPTSGSTVTRSADIASITGTNFSSFYNNNEGTVLFDAALGESTNSAPSIVFANYLWATSPNVWRTLANTGIMSTGSSRTTRTKHAFGLQQNNHSVSINGSISSAFDNNSTSPSSSGPVSFNANGNTLNGYISRLTYYPKRLPNYQLQALTR